MSDVPGTGKARRVEETYFHRHDRELLERARAAHHSQREQEALAAAIGSYDAEAIGCLHAWGMRADSAALLEWVPAIEVAWLDGLDDGERTVLRDGFAAAHAGEPARRLLDEWLAHRPSHALFAAARRALRLQLQKLGDRERRNRIDRVAARCEEAGRAAGGMLGFGSLSGDERQHINFIRQDLARANDLGAMAGTGGA